MFSVITTDVKKCIFFVPKFIIDAFFFSNKKYMGYSISRSPDEVYHFKNLNIGPTKIHFKHRHKVRKIGRRQFGRRKVLKRHTKFQF
jgi:hypothetical protein